MESIFVTKIICEARSGSVIYRCCREAAALALTENRQVELIFNDKIYTYKPELLVEKCTEKKATR